MRRITHKYYGVRKAEPKFEYNAVFLVFGLNCTINKKKPQITVGFQRFTAKVCKIKNEILFIK